MPAALVTDAQLAAALGIRGRNPAAAARRVFPFVRLAKRLHVISGADLLAHYQSRRTGGDALERCAGNPRRRLALVAEQVRGHSPGSSAN